VAQRTRASDSATGWGEMRPSADRFVVDGYPRCASQLRRVRGRVDLLQLVDRDVGVDLRRRHAGVAEQCLDVADVGPVFQHVVSATAR